MIAPVHHGDSTDGHDYGGSESHCLEHGIQPDSQLPDSQHPASEDAPHGPAYWSTVPIIQRPHMQGLLQLIQQHMTHGCFDEFVAGLPTDNDDALRAILMALPP